MIYFVLMAISQVQLPCVSTWEVKWDRSYDDEVQLLFIFDAWCCIGTVARLWRLQKMFCAKAIILALIFQGRRIRVCTNIIILVICEFSLSSDCFQLCQINHLILCFSVQAWQVVDFPVSYLFLNSFETLWWNVLALRGICSNLIKRFNWKCKSTLLSTMKKYNFL